MPLKTCNENNKPGYKWGDQGKCYTYTPNNPASQKSAKKKAIKQGIAIEGPDKFKEEVTKSAELSELVREVEKDDQLEQMKSLLR